MSISNLIKRLQDIMRNDAGVDGDAQRISQIVWLLFLKVYDAKEQAWMLEDDNYTSIIPEELQWHKWAVDLKDGKALTGDALLKLVNDQLFPAFKQQEITLGGKKIRLSLTKDTPFKNRIVFWVFEDAINYMKDGVLLRQVINVLNEVDFDDYKDLHAFGEIYETLLKSLQSAGNAGEFYTPRAVTDFMVQMIDPKIGESVADFACGTGGFLTSALRHKEKSQKTAADILTINSGIYGIEKKPLPYLLCMTNMLLHGLDEPQIHHMNSLERNVREYRDDEKFDIILMNPPYGGGEKEIVKQSFPATLRSSETAECVCLVAFLRRTRASQQTFCFSIMTKMAQKQPGFTEWTSQKAINTFQKQNRFC